MQKHRKKIHMYAFELCAAISDDFENSNFQIQKANLIIELCSALTWDGVYCVCNKVKYLELLSFDTAILRRIVQIEKTDILLLQQLKVPIWAVEKQYFECPSW